MPSDAPEAARDVQRRIEEAARASPLWQAYMAQA